MASYFARPVRSTGDFLIFRDGFELGRLANCEAALVFESRDDELEAYVNDRFEGGMSLHEMLNVIREQDEYLVEQCRKESEAEHRAENAWLHHAERYDHEAQADLELHNQYNPHGYGF